jgi:hypothetical protein
MKYSILFLALLSSNALACGSCGNKDVVNVDAEATSSSASSSSSSSTNTLNNGSNTLNGGSNSVDIDNERNVPSAISPSVGTANDCQIATPSSKAMSVLIFSVSGTTGVTYNPLCYAYKRGQFDVADKLMCLQSKEYAEANEFCKR